MIRASRKALGLTQQQLADLSGINVRQIQKIEAGEINLKNITLANAAGLAAALGIPIEDLLSKHS